ncbi:MAG: FMN-binding protein [Gammaproteobacteria bacterium]|nr:FMN-binding protein [Gammaproteobacteria bacterium]
MIHTLRAFIVISLILSSITVFARGVYQTDQDFLAETFNQAVPKSKVVWVKGELAKTITEILGHKYVGLRIRYWRVEQRSVWILEEIGKEKPITFGVVVADEKIETIKVLAFRESRGGEIRHPAFTQQFRDARLDALKLDRHIDGVSGATLSVRAMTDVARMALYLDKFTDDNVKL